MYINNLYPSSTLPLETADRALVISISLKTRSYVLINLSRFEDFETCTVSQVTFERHLRNIRYTRHRYWLPGKGSTIILKFYARTWDSPRHCTERFCIQQSVLPGVIRESREINALEII